MDSGRIPWYYLDAVPLDEASLHVAKVLGYFEYAETLSQKWCEVQALARAIYHVIKPKMVALL